MANESLLEFIQGDVFDAKSFGVDGLAVFYHGLSAIRAEAGKHEADAKFNAAFRAVRYIDTDGQGPDGTTRVENVEVMRKLINDILGEFAAGNCRKIAMNGIRVYNLPDAHVRPEKYQIQFIKEWLALHPGVFEKICLIDQRDGFNRADDKI